ncbi:hypothetical protein GCM10010335_11700 [Streptomyces galbus]|nr:hypothetical protein GCM10010335_11700 [Streptomyces galbus]
MPVTRIPRGVGYLDVRATGVTSSQYRRRFGVAAQVSRREALSASQPTRIRSTPSR